MKLAGLLLLLPASLAIAAPPAETKPKLSEHLRQELATFRPAFIPPPATADASEPESTTPDPDLLILPKLEVTERRLPGSDPDLWLADSVVQRKAMTQYRDSMSPVEWALNCWYIPLISPPPSARARQAYRAAKVRDETQRLDTIISAIQRLDPKEAQRLRYELYRPSDSLPAKEN